MRIFNNIENVGDKELRLSSKTGRISKNTFYRKLSVDEVLEEIEKNHNHSWFIELYERNKNNLGDIALLYRGNKITYREMFDNMISYAKSMKELGLGKNSEIPVCISNTPEIVYIMGAASLIGAKVNIFGSKYPEDYVTEIINGCNTDIIFVEDNAYQNIEGAIRNSKVNKIMMTSLRDSLKGDFNPYEELDKKSNLFHNKVSIYKQSNHKIMNQKEFINIGKNYRDVLDASTDIDTDFVITYTSGSTNENRPKAIVHSSRNFITIARFHDKDINGISTKSFISLAHIPTFSNTNLVSCISDSLMQGAKLALEPNYDKDFFINSILMYQPNYIAATKSFWIHTAKKVLYDEKYKNVKFDNLLLAFSCGEPFEINEEKLINRSLKKAKAGTAVTHTSFSLVRMSEAAGDCEHGSIFYTLFRSYANNKPKNKKKQDAEGLTPFDFVEVAVLNEKGEICNKNELGRVVANSPCTMKRYHHNEEATKKFFIKDAYGKQWADMNVYGFIDLNDKVYIRGRIPKKEEILPPFLIAKQILKDTKNILSCEVIKDQETENYIAHIELQPENKSSVNYALYSADQRCHNLVKESGSQIYYRIRSNEESFPLTKSGKRDVKALQNEGLTKKCIRPFVYNGKIYLDSYDDRETSHNKIIAKK